jgi:uncharacterized C2H2 Zn-finger protein
MSEWVTAYPGTSAELPPWDHQCRAQTRGVNDGDRVYRCPCGAIALYDTSYWSYVNRTRTGRGEQPPRRRWWRRAPAR